MIFDFRRTNESATCEPLIIHNHRINQVSEYKYLGTVIDSKLNFHRNSELISGKANQRLYFLRKLKVFCVDNRILTLFYQSLIQSLVTFNLLCTYGNVAKENIKGLERPRKIAQRLINSDLPPISSLFEKLTLLKVHKVMNDSTHPLHTYYSFNRPGIRLCVPKSIRNRSRFSFVPNSIHMFNNNVTR